MRGILLTVTVAVLLPTFCWGWGRDGHRIIATVAEDHLNETTKVMIQSLIGNNHLYSVASWADDIRRERRDTGPWHYVNIPLGSKYNASRDCPLPRSCVVEKIADFIKILTDKKASREQRAEALKFAVHFVGDIHQPMHAAKEAKGASIKIEGHWYCQLRGGALQQAQERWSGVNWFPLTEKDSKKKLHLNDEDGRFWDGEDED